MISPISESEFAEMVATFMISSLVEIILVLDLRSFRTCEMTPR